MTKQGNKFLYLRGEFWNYKRNVPLKFEHIEPRKRIRAALNTKSLDVAKLRRDALVEAEDAYWTALLLQADASGGITDTTRRVQEHQYKAASKRALSFGFIYKTARQLTTETPIDDLMERVELLAAQYKDNQPPPKMETTTLLGGVTKPASEAMRVSAAFKLYVIKIAFDAQLKKSPAQKRSWEQAKQTSIDYFITAIADVDMGDI